jgi:hypothetical protein
MAEFEVRIQGDEQAIAELRDVTPKLRAALENAIKRMQIALVNSAKAFYAQALKSRSGALRGSIKAGDFVANDREIRGDVVAGGGDLFYARAQEYGATIHAKNVANLTIPLDAAKTAMGVGRFSARQVISDPTQFGYTGTFFKHGVLFGNAGGKGGAPTPLFVLRPSVTLPPRPFMRPALAQIAARLPAEIERAVEEATR